MLDAYAREMRRLNIGLPEGYWWEHPNGVPVIVAHGLDLHATAALALCRCACEDFLMERGWELFSKRGEWWCVKPIGDDKEILGWKAHTNIHTAILHALEAMP